MFFSSIKEINRLLSKGMSNICLKITIEILKLLLKLLLIEMSNFLWQLKSQRSGSKTVCGFSIIFILKGTMTF